MEDKKYALSFFNDKDSGELNKGVSFVRNPKLINCFIKGKYKNENNSLVFKETIETSFSDLLKIKVNVKLIGFFLVTFKNNEDNNQKCLDIIEKVKKINNCSIFNLENQRLKIIKIINIINEYNPVFVSFVLEKSVPKNYVNFREYNFGYPFLFIDNVTKEESIKQIKNKKIHLKFCIEAPFFNVDYLFNLLFALFASFSLHTSVSLFSSSNWKGVLFIILALALICILNYCLYSIFYNNDAEELKGQKIIMSLYLCFGTGIGLIIGILVLQNFLNFSYNGWDVFIDIFAFVLCLGAILASKIIALFKKRKF